ncbi:pyridoxal phosphate-dependent decarboxylase family protein [Ensifer aridi]|uniref:pyridoxal phosphate-dependent decarboxylase family protein n=1 Tax=Ensifer aridi TaxID=1708715 RepID=UPI000A10F419|nr:aspartate aminotransferase family protein [Ensifer aridi]
MNMNVAALKLAPAAEADHADQILGTDAPSRLAFKDAMLQAVDMVAHGTAAASSLYSGTGVAGLRALLDDLDPLPKVGTGIAAALADIGRPALEHALTVGHPAAMAHLHCPVAVPALAAEVLISATNQSLDSWDQSPFATLVEERVLTLLTELAGLPASASGNFTSGGSQSNMTALYLAAERYGADARKSGVILTSEHSHFSIRKSAAVLGFADDAVISIASDEAGRMSMPALEAGLQRVVGEGRVPIAVVATAGTTDLGAIDPLVEIADVAAARDLWMHVDAAYGGGLLFSRHRDRLQGLERAHSIALDFHKMLFQPISCGALLIRDRAHFAPLASKADYLNPEDAVFADAPNLVERSVQTTRRADALKVLMTMRAIGRDGLDALICQTLENTRAAAEAVEARDYLRLARRPSLSTVLFRYVSAGGPELSDAITLKTRAALFHAGIAALATTVLDGRVHFKLTLLNPRSTPDVVHRVLDAIGETARELEAHHART